ncbi:MAG: HD domain-containing protein [Planctomycetaceae bacterium]|nr:HD domain-containing protein [Planctomycetaceae bacterium]
MPDSGEFSVATNAARPVAVIDVGTSSIRMAVAEIDSSGEVRVLETLAQGVSLGKDTFTKGEIERSTIEDCVRVLRRYAQTLEEYRITSANDVRVVATSAVREASNRLAFLDRIYVATGFTVDAIDTTEVHRITYRSIQPQLRSSKVLRESRVIITEVGGGSTELLLVDNGEVAYSHSYRLGSLRLRESLSEYRASPDKMQELMESQIQRTIEQLPHHIDTHDRSEMVALGGDMRFAARELLRGWDPDSLARLTVAEFGELAYRMLKLTPDEIVRKYRVSFQDAETLGPAMLVYLDLARLLDLDHINVSNANLRDGLLHEMASNDVWTDDFRNQIVRSALELGRKYHFDEPHAKHVAVLSGAVFAALASEHQLDDRAALILHIAALLHEIGSYVNQSSLHKHSLYLILNSELFGLTKEDMTLVALVARYHRRASPKPTHLYYGTLERTQRVAVSKMAAILRLADALDTSRSQRVGDISCEIEADRLIITVSNLSDLSVEQLAMQQARTLFQEIFGLRVLLRAGGR